MTYHPPVSLNELKKRLSMCHGDQVTIDESSYIRVTIKARFIDKDYGEWWALPNLVARRNSPRGHPKRGNKKISQKKTISIEQLIEKIQQRHNDEIKLDISTYSYINTKALFIDKEFGEWWAYPRHILKGGCHPKKRTNKKRRLSIDVIKKRLMIHHGDIVKLDESSFLNKSPSAHEKVRFIDKDYGEWWALAGNVYGEGKGHPKRGFIKAQKKCARVLTIKHWNCSDLCHCRGSYEQAVVHWLNKNEYDFDWQIAFKTPILTKTGKNSIYYVDLYIKDGPHKDKFIEIKGYWMQEISRKKWEWFHETHQNSELWNFNKLKKLKILT